MNGLRNFSSSFLEMWNSCKLQHVAEVISRRWVRNLGLLDSLIKDFSKSLDKLCYFVFWQIWCQILVGYIVLSHNARKTFYLSIFLILFLFGKRSSAKNMERKRFFCCQRQNSEWDIWVDVRKAVNWHNARSYERFMPKTSGFVYSAWNHLVGHTNLWLFGQLVKENPGKII